MSYNRHDQHDVEFIAHQLKDRGLALWFDHWHLTPGDQWQSEIEAALRTCDACTVFVGPHGTGPWQHEEMRSAISRRVLSPGFRVIPVFLPGAPAETDGLSEFLLAGHGVRFESLSDPDAIRVLIGGIHGLAPGPPQGQQAPARVVYEVVITGSIKAADKQKVEAMFDHLRKLSGDADLTLKAVRMGSIVFVLEGQISGYEKLKQLLERGELSTVFGESALEVRPPDRPEVAAQSRTQARPGHRASVAIVDEEVSILSRAFENILEIECEIVGTYSDPRALLQDVATLKPDVTILQASSLPACLDTARHLLQLLPTTRVIFLATNESPQVAAEAFRLGASGYLLRRFAGSELLRAVREVTMGRYYVTPLLAGKLAGALSRSSHANRMGSQAGLLLTPRQREVLRLLAEGRSMSEVAANLNLTVRTVAFHKHRMMEQLGVKNLTELVKWADVRAARERNKD